MITPPARQRAKRTGLLIVAALVVPGAAGAVVLPERAPLPSERPAASASALHSTPRFPEPVRISTQKQEIPESRRDVRVVGARFLPVADESIDFASAGDDQLTAIDHAERFLMMAVTRLFERSHETEPVQVAATND
jgi:hypothetical protein